MTIQLNKITLFLLLYLRHIFRPNKAPLQFTLCPFPETASLCSYLTLQEYLSRTESSRVAANTTKLFLSFIVPYRLMSTDTCSRWLKTVL